MRDFAKRPENDRKDLFRTTAQSMDVREAIIEKDFWVCWVLDYLFHDSPWKDKIIFKGGTSLSKAYGAIQRFSEDVDLILDWSLLGLSEEVAFQDRSSNKQKEFGEDVSERTIQFLQTDFMPICQTELRNRLGCEVGLTQDNQSVLIEYPRSFAEKSLQEQIILEIGPKALRVPNELRKIQSYAAEHSPKFFMIPSTEVRTVSAERTFWEKATILHQEAHRDANKELPSRHSRHYYDLYRLSKTSVIDDALKKLDLLDDVAYFKMKFFRSPWAKYDEAKPGTLKLLPPQYRMDELKKDYESMQVMLFGTIPSFEEIINGLAALEKEINDRGNTQ